MLTRIRRLPSPALVISALALIAAVGGGTFAVAASDKKQDVKKISKKEIKKAAPTLSVDKAKTADSATTRDNATTRRTPPRPTPRPTRRTPTTPSRPRSRTSSAAGVLDAANSKNVGAVTQVGPASTASRESRSRPRGGQATVDAVGSASQSAQVGIGTGAVCPVGTQAFVVTISTAAAFYVVLYR